MANYDAKIRVHTEIDNSEIKKAEKEVERLAKKLDSVRKRSAKVESLGGSAKQLESLGYDAEMLENELADATERLEQLRSKGFVKAEKSAKKLSATMKVLRNIVLSMIAFQVIAKGAEYIADGFKNLIQYSSELNGVFSGLKSETATLKNSMATAFAPIVAQIIPYLTTLVSWLNTAMNAIAQFWAVLGGKNTYTRAKKQVVDYAKSLKDASKTAKGTLAAFDELNVLKKNEGTNAGGELSGADAFEEAKVDEAFVSALERVKNLLEIIAPLVLFIGGALLTWKVTDFLASIMKANPLLGDIAAWLILIIGGALMIYNYFSMWKDGVDWKGLIGFISGVSLVVGALYMLFGPLVAGITLIVAGIAGLVLAIKDIIENGMNAENMALLLVSAVGILAGVFMAFGAKATIITGIIMAVVGALASLVAYSGNGKEALNHLKDTFKALGDFVSKVFVGDIEGAFESLKEAGRSFGNFFLSIAEGIANGFIKMVNAAIDAINSLSFDVPDWLQKITGMRTFGFNIPHWSAHVSLPRLATGGIVTSSTLANIGEAGREAVLPLENNTEWMDILADRINNRGGETRVVVELDGKVVYDNVVKRDHEFAGRTGHSQFAY